MDVLSNLNFNEEFMRIFESAVGSTREGISIADTTRDGFPLIFVNRAFCEMTGYQPLEVIGRNCNFLQGEETDPKAVAKIRKALANKQSLTIALLNYRKDGTPFYNRLSLAPVFGFDKKLTHYVGIQSDITRELETEKNLRQYEAMKTTLESVNHVVLNFMSHLQFYYLKLSREGANNAEILKDWDESFNKAKEALERLNNLTEYRERDLSGNIRMLDFEAEQQE